MSRSPLRALLVVLILLSGIPILMTCAACPEGDAAMLLWACLAVLIAAVDVVAGGGMPDLVGAREPQHGALIVDRLERPPHPA